MRVNHRGVMIDFQVGDMVRVKGLDSTGTYRQMGLARVHGTSARVMEGKVMVVIEHSKQAVWVGTWNLHDADLEGPYPL